MFGEEEWELKYLFIFFASVKTQRFSVPLSSEKGIDKLMALEKYLETHG